MAPCDRYLSQLVSEERFYEMLRKYVHELYHGRLVHSTEFLALFFETFKSEEAVQSQVNNLAAVCRDWLDTDGLPPALVEAFEDLLHCPPDDIVNFSTRKWLEFNEATTTRRKRSRPGGRCHKDAVRSPTVDEDRLSSERLHLVLENLLEANFLSKSTLTRLDARYEFKERQNVDVQHRWYELVVKHVHLERLMDVEAFLEEHQSMGVYLYGEMMASSSKRLRRSALKVFHRLKSEMDPNTAVVIKRMAEG